MALLPGIIPGWPGYVGIPGYLDKEGWAYGCPSEIIPRSPGYLGIPGYLDKGEVYGCLSWDYPEMARLLGNRGIFGQWGHTALLPGIILG